MLFTDINHIIDEVLNKDKAARARVEVEKADQKFDLKLSKTIVNVARSKKLALTEADLEWIVDRIKRSYNVIVAFYALCETSEDIERAKLKTKILGRLPEQKYSKRLPNEVEAALRDVIEEVEKSLHPEVNYTVDKKLIRKKLRNAAALLVRLLRECGVDKDVISWDECIVDG